MRIILEQLHDGLPQRAAEARQRDELAVAPQRQAVGRAKPHGSALVLVDGDDPIARQAVGHADVAGAVRIDHEHTLSLGRHPQIPCPIFVNEMDLRSARTRAAADCIDVILPCSMTSRPSLVPTQMRPCRSSMSADTVSPDKPLCRLNKVMPCWSSR